MDVDETLATTKMVEVALRMSFRESHSYSQLLPKALRGTKNYAYKTALSMQWQFEFH